MKLNYKGLMLWFLGFYFLVDPLRELLLKGSTQTFDFPNGWMDVIWTVTSLIPLFLFSLLAYSSFFYFYRVKKWLLLIISLLLSFSLPIILRFLVQEKVMDFLFGVTNYKRGVDPLYYFRDNLYFGVIFVSLGIVYFFVDYARYKDKREKELTIANQKMELSLLRSQINPHFLLNSMNNIYSLVYQKSDKALAAVDKLSNMLKYSLYESKEMVQLEEELTYLDNYIELQKLRYDYEPAIKRTIPEEILTVEVPQFMLIPLIENGFKHGELRDDAEPLNLEIKNMPKGLNIYVHNKKRAQEVDEAGGIGLENVRKRLNLLYNGQHTFEVIETETHFTVHINIPVK